MTKSTAKSREEFSNKQVDDLLLQGFQKLAMITPMAPDVDQGPEVSDTTVVPTYPSRSSITDAGPNLKPFIKRP